MKDFIIQVLATLFSSLVIFCISKIFNKVKQIPKEKIVKYLYSSFVILFSFVMVNNIVVNLKTVLKVDFGVIYIISLISLTICFFTTVDYLRFIKNILFNNKS